MRVFDLLIRVGQNLHDLYQLFQGKFFKVIGYALLASLIAIGLNFAGLKTANAIIGCIFPIVIAYLASRPEVMTGLLGTGTAKSVKNPIAGTTDVAKIWAGFIGAILLYLSVFFLIAGTVQFSRNPAAIPVIYLSLIVLFLTGVVWGMKTVIAKKLVYWYAVTVFMVTFGSLISGAIWDKTVGFDPYFVFRVSPVDDAIYDFEELERNQAEKSVEKQIKVIIKKIKKGKKIIEQERDFLRQQKEERDQRRIPARISRKVSGWISSAYASTPDPRAENVKENRWWDAEIVLGKDQVIELGTFEDGDILRTWSSHGF
ncbi:hypothetical protein KKE75_04920, partial [Patescibacteria group bacterium]|nr:hypothetical protein [Patescibacteria group bacterium]